MLASELIAILQKMLESCGDLEVQHEGGGIRCVLVERDAAHPQGVIMLSDGP